MNFLSIFVLIPLLMLLGLWLSRNIAQIRAVMVAGASARFYQLSDLPLFICKPVMAVQRMKCCSVQKQFGIRHLISTIP